MIRRADDVPAPTPPTPQIAGPAFRAPHNFVPLDSATCSARNPRPRSVSVLLTSMSTIDVVAVFRNAVVERERAGISP